MILNVFKIFSYICIMHFVVIGNAYAVQEAGEIQRKENKTPHANLFIEKDVTDISLLKNPENENIDAINFSADELLNDEINSTIIASGNVEINYNNNNLRADKIIYNQNTDTIQASGNIIIKSTDNTVIYSDNVELTNHMSLGNMENIKIILKDQSQVFAKNFKKKNNQTKIMKDVSYTACDLCGEKPTWTVFARKVSHDETSKNINYNDAIIKIKDVPVFYTPFFTHPDPTVKRRSGLLAPSIGSSNYLGAYFQPVYFWDVNDQTNVIISPIYSIDKGLIADGKIAHYLYSGNITSAFSYLKDTDSKQTKNRGHIFTNGRYDINDFWRAKYDLKYVSDDLYLKEFSLPYKDDAWLNSNIQFERFNGRNYASIDTFYYKMLSYNLQRQNISNFDQVKNNKPTVAPLVDVEVYSDPSSIGSYFKTNLNTASIYNDNGSTSQRVTAINSWELPYTTRFGEKYKIVASVKSDAYYVNKYQYLYNQSYSGTPIRVFPQLGMEWRLPFVRSTDTTRQILEPIVVGVLAPNGANKQYKIPNEDSENIQLDDTNILDLDRYSGYDRNDTGSRLSYGLKWSSYDDKLGKTSAFIAQSYQYGESDFINMLEYKKSSNFSDLVGRINAEPNEYLDLNYRFRLDKDNFKSKYDEFSTAFGPSFLRGDISYIFLQNNKNYSELNPTRKELYTSVSTEISQFWTVSLYNLADLTKHNKKSLEHGAAATYEDECSKLIGSIKKYNSSNPDLQDDYEFSITFVLKTIGSFGS